MAEPARTLLIEKSDVETVIKRAEEAVSARLDISTLKSGDIIEGRYKFIEKIGKGAFGTVLLVEDTVVDERLILKFLEVGHERDNATAEVRRSFGGQYGPLYQMAYLVGGLQIRGMKREVVDSGMRTEKDFHDEIMRQASMPVAFLRLAVSKIPL